MVGGTVMGFVGGLHYWWPKFTGKMYDESWARVGWFFVFIGFNVTFLSQFVLGSRGMPRRYYDYLPQFEQLHQVSTVGSWLIGFGFLTLGIMFIRSLIGGKPAPRNPWGSAALEWMTPTPPPLYKLREGPGPHARPVRLPARHRRRALRGLRRPALPSNDRAKTVAAAKAGKDAE